MQKACDSVLKGSMSQREAAKQFSVPRATLQKIVSGRTEVGMKLGKKAVMGNLETKLVDYAVNRAALGVGFGKKEFLNYTSKLAKKHNITFKRGRPSDKWWRLMKKRNKNMTLRRPEPTAAVRHMCMLYCCNFRNNNPVWARSTMLLIKFWERSLCFPD